MTILICVIFEYKMGESLIVDLFSILYTLITQTQWEECANDVNNKKISHVIMDVFIRNPARKDQFSNTNLSEDFPFQKAFKRSIFKTGTLNKKEITFSELVQCNIWCQTFLNFTLDSNSPRFCKKSEQTYKLIEKWMVIG